MDQEQTARALHRLPACMASRIEVERQRGTQTLKLLAHSQQRDFPEAELLLNRPAVSRKEQKQATDKGKSESAAGATRKLQMEPPSPRNRKIDAIANVKA